MQRIILFFILSAASANVHGQYEFEHAFSFGPDDNIRIPMGDTINRGDSARHPHGFHIYVKGWSDTASDSNEWTCGYFTHGQPTGEWIHHLADGSYSVGAYKGLTGFIVMNGTSGEWLELDEGLDCKIGIWKYYSRDSILVQTMKYEYTFDHSGTTYTSHLLDSSGNFKMIRYQFANRFDEESCRSVVIDKQYTASGLPVSYFTTKKRKSISRLYEFNGVLYNKTITRYKKHDQCVLIVIQYNLAGQRFSRRRERCVEPGRLGG